MWLGDKKDINFSSYISVDNEPVMCKVSSIDELTVDINGGGSTEGKKIRWKVSLN
jgi:hypothetical protein